MTTVSPEEFDRVGAEYTRRFKKRSLSWGYYPSPEQAVDMMREAMRRGTPVTDDDYPEIPADVVY